ncbi:MAG: type II/IV secretion system protein [Deltaproteobacteria bacterium]|nr:type II/IV secretion system protein [Deltaproteobacteria bacterium]
MMDELLVSKDAQVSLVRFIAKIGLIDSKSGEFDYSCTDECPILHYSKRGCFDEWEAINRVAESLDLKRYKVSQSNYERFAALLEDPAVSKIDLATWIAMRAAPAEIEPNLIIIMMANPFDQNSRRMLEFNLGRTVQGAIGSEREIIALLSKKRRSGDLYELDKILSDSAEDPLQSASEEPLHNQESCLINSDLEAAPVVRLANKILADAVNLGASDLHIAPEKEGLAVRVRVDGIMRKLFTVPNTVKNAVVSRIKLLGGMDISEKRKPQDGRLRIKTSAGVKDLRLSTVPTLYGENLVARILSTEVSAISFESLGMPADMVEHFERVLSGSSRVVLVSGPTGSGKTSTLYSALLYLADGKRNIVTVEDPIEYRIRGITQIQVNKRIGMDFASGLKSILRQDPDVIMVGEVRDDETAEIAMQAAQTGHLVLSTIHTNSAPAAVTRLVDLNVPHFLIASSLGSIIAQRLVRMLCPHCATAPSSQALERYEALGLDTELIKEAQGCDLCCQSGFKGRTAIYSFLEICEEVRAAIRENRGEAEIAERARAAGYRTLEEYARILLCNGTTSLDEVERVLGPLSAVEVSHNGEQVLSAPCPQQTAPASDSKKKTLSKPKVLLVEDDDDVRFILTALLEKEMFEVREARDGVEALEAVYQEFPDLILCDLMMPRMDGLELLERLKRDARTAKIPMLMLTAADSEENELELLNRGADDFVSKAARADLVVARVHRLLSRLAS